VSEFANNPSASNPLNSRITEMTDEVVKNVDNAIEPLSSQKK
jgi:hypothetical protein